MNKYYVSYAEGEYEEKCLTILANSPMQACAKTMGHLMNNYTESMPLNFRVSERGPDEHDDDLIIGTGEVIKYQYEMVNGEPLC